MNDKINVDKYIDKIYKYAIGFGEWVVNSTYLNLACGKWWHPTTETFYTTEELFQIYLKTIDNE